MTGMFLQDSSATATPSAPAQPSGAPSAPPSAPVAPVAPAPAVPAPAPVDGPQPSQATPSSTAPVNHEGGSGMGQNTDTDALRAWLTGQGPAPANLAQLAQAPQPEPAPAPPAAPPATTPPAPAPAPAPAPEPTPSEPAAINQPGKLPALNVRPADAQDMQTLANARELVRTGQAPSITAAVVQLMQARQPAAAPVAPAPAPAAPEAPAAPVAPAPSAPPPTVTTPALTELESRLAQIEIDHTIALTNLDQERAVELVKERQALTAQIAQARAAAAVQHSAESLIATEWDAAQAAAIVQHPQLADPDSAMHILVQSLVNRDSEQGVPDAGTAASLQRAIATAQLKLGTAPSAPPSAPIPQPPPRPPGVSYPGILGVTANPAGSPAPTLADAEAAAAAMIQKQVNDMRRAQGLRIGG